MTAKAVYERGGGQTTRLCAHYVQLLLRHPGEPVKVFDHHGSPEAHWMLSHKILEVLDLLGVKYKRHGPHELSIIPLEK